MGLLTREGLHRPNTGLGLRRPFASQVLLTWRQSAGQVRVQATCRRFRWLGLKSKRALVRSVCDQLTMSRATVDGRNFASKMSRRKQTSHQQSTPHPQFQCCCAWERRAAQCSFENRKFRKCDAKRTLSTLTSGERGLTNRPLDGEQSHARLESCAVFATCEFFSVN